MEQSSFRAAYSLELIAGDNQIWRGSSCHVPDMCVTKHIDCCTDLFSFQHFAADDCSSKGEIILKAWLKLCHWLPI